jgi:hypothetical protein
MVPWFYRKIFLLGFSKQYKVGKTFVNFFCSCLNVYLFLASYFVELFSTFIIYGGKLDINIFFVLKVVSQYRIYVLHPGVGLVCFWKKAIYFKSAVNL